jgi:hypothetical protein
MRHDTPGPPVEAGSAKQGTSALLSRLDSPVLVAFRVTLVLLHPRRAAVKTQKSDRNLAVVRPSRLPASPLSSPHIRFRGTDANEEPARGDRQTQPRVRRPFCSARAASNAHVPGPPGQDSPTSTPPFSPLPGPDANLSWLARGKPRRKCGGLARPPPTAPKQNVGPTSCLVPVCVHPRPAHPLPPLA